MNRTKPKIRLIQGDCLEVLKNIKSQSIDLILTDPPYGTTACKWDSVIPFEPMWMQLKRIIKRNGVVLLFGSEPFSSNLRISNIKNYKYDFVWKKNNSFGFVHSKNKPLTITENISVFSKAPMGHKSLLGDRRMNYIPQGIKKSKEKKIKKTDHGNLLGARPNQVGNKYTSYTNFPTNFLKFDVVPNKIHPSEKPVSLLMYLIKTYTKEKDSVLDFTMGSGSTGVACIKTNRNFIGIEKEEDIFQLAKDRIKKLKFVKGFFNNDFI